MAAGPDITAGSGMFRKLRRELLKGGALLGLAGFAPMAAAITIAPPRTSRRRGRTQVDVRDHGARGDGRHDDTRAFQAAIDALPASGGVVRVPSGRYLIDPVRSVRLRARMHLALARDAVLVAKPNAVQKAYVLLVLSVDDVEISGGRIIGDRHQHQSSKGEWGHGIQLRGASGVTIRDMLIEDCWGDGICIGGLDPSRTNRRVVPTTDVVIARVRCRNNRRQGLTIGRSRRVQVHDSEFSGTHGTPPAAGIDVEPDRGDRATDVTIATCLVRGNQGPGIQLYKWVDGVVVRDCTIEGNRGEGILAVGSRNAEIHGNRIRGNRRKGITIRGGADGFDIAGNVISGNGPRSTGAKRNGVSLKASQVQVADDARAVRLSSDNRYAE